MLKHYYSVLHKEKHLRLSSINSASWQHHHVAN